MRDAYRAFHGREPREYLEFEVPDMPLEMWCLGRVEYVGYRAADGTLYEHEFEPELPLLCYDEARPGQGRLYFLGGDYYVDPDGIKG